MPKSRIKAADIGKYKRFYDELSDDNEEDAAELADVLSWLQDNIPKVPVNKPKAKYPLRDLATAGLQLGQDNKFQALQALNASPYQGHLFEKAFSVLKDVVYGARDLFSGKRVKTTLAIGGGIAAGAAVGAVLGTFVFPGIGSAIGGAAGAAIASGVALAGGTVGLTIIGAFVGSWFGKKFSKKAFKHEKHFEVSKRNTDKIKKRVGIDSKTTQMINGYLYNRSKTVESTACQKYYKMLRKHGIDEANPFVMEQISRFFCKELILLEHERKRNGSSPSLAKERQAVIHILSQLKEAKGLSAESRQKIKETMDASKEKKSKDSPMQGLEYTSDVEIFPEDMLNAKEKFMSHLPDLGIKNVELINSKPKKNSIAYRYQIVTQDNLQLPDVVFKGKKDKNNHYQATILVDGNELNNQNQDKVVQVIVAQAKAYQEKTGKSDIIILAGGDDELAVKIMAAVLKSGLKPSLDSKEYPGDSVMAQKRIKMISERANALVESMSEPHDTLKRKVPFSP